MTPRSAPHRRGFTLLELVILLAIIAVLSSIALSALGRFRLRSVAAEAITNIASIRTAEKAYFAEYSEYVSAAVSPATANGGSSQPFVDASGAFGTIGWLPNAPVYFRYAVAVDGLSFTADASADLDSDAAPQIWGYVQDAPDGSVTPGFLACTGVWDPTAGTATATGVVGPCHPDYGRSVF
jgi:prepilin-type N-terminal cleavage/methylation domain-containing protein